MIFAFEVEITKITWAPTLSPLKRYEREAARSIVLEQQGGQVAELYDNHLPILTSARLQGCKAALLHVAFLE